MKNQTHNTETLITLIDLIGFDNGFTAKIMGGQTQALEHSQDDFEDSESEIHADLFAI